MIFRHQAVAEMWIKIPWQGEHGGGRHAPDAAPGEVTGELTGELAPAVGAGVGQKLQRVLAALSGRPAA
jgi:hypothetical protein